MVGNIVRQVTTDTGFEAQILLEEPVFPPPRFHRWANVFDFGTTTDVINTQLRSFDARVLQVAIKYGHMFGRSRLMVRPLEPTITEWKTPLYLYDILGSRYPTKAHNFICATGTHCPRDSAAKGILNALVCVEILQRMGQNMAEHSLDSLEGHPRHSLW